jgi:hypothetical protein
LSKFIGALPIIIDINTIYKILAARSIDILLATHASIETHKMVYRMIGFSGSKFLQKNAKKSQKRSNSGVFAPCAKTKP